MRDEEQSFNRIDVAGDSVTLTVQAWGGSSFVPAASQKYVLQDEQWLLAGAEKELQETAG